MPRQFKSAAAFKASLEEHLRKLAAQTDLPFQTLQLKFTMERLLARLFHSPAPPWLLKGGFAMDLRFRPKARTTKDLDLSVPLVTMSGKNAVAAVRDMLQAAVDVDLGDYLIYRIGDPKRELTNAPGGGGRFPCESVLVGKAYTKFHLDVGCGDAVVGQPERLVGADLLKFADIAPAIALAITKAQQFAEKIHAYSFPWGDRLNTRTKDLVDLLLLIERGPPASADIRAALRATFTTRNTHRLPERLSPPPEAWKADFALMATEAGLSTTDYLDGFRLVVAFWERERLAA
jgi:Nucleotidyl transferase AbiEii toxin, Type IV TA system